MKKALSLLSLIMCAAIAVPAFAHHNSSQFNRYDRIEKRLDNQRHRIRMGIDSGELTRKEARRLVKQQRHIMRLSHHFMKDGRLRRHEFNVLLNELNQASNRIRHLKNNNRHRYAVYYY